MFEDKTLLITGGTGSFGNAVTAILEFPAILIRTSTERPEVLDKGTIVIGGIAEDQLIQSVELTREMWENGEKSLLVNDYHDDNVSVKVVKIIQSYVSIVNNDIWKKIN